MGWKWGMVLQIKGATTIEVKRLKKLALEELKEEKSTEGTVSYEMGQGNRKVPDPGSPPKLHLELEILS